MPKKSSSHKSLPKKRPPSNKKKPTKAQILKLIYDCIGNLSEVARSVGFDRRTVRKWIDADKDLLEALEESRELMIDIAEDSLVNLVQGVTVEEYDPLTRQKKVFQRPPCKTSTIFMLKTQGRNRGYKEEDPKNNHSSELLAQFMNIMKLSNANPKDSSS